MNRKGESNIDSKYLKQDNENLFDYYKRITLNKKVYDLDYSEWGKLILGDEVYSSENLRKGFYILEKMFQKLDNEQIDNIDDESILDKIRNTIGELDIKKQEVRNKTNELNKIKREFVKSISLADELKDYMKENCSIVIPEYCYNPVDENSQYEMIVHITDWHIGYMIDDCKGNYFNWEIANKRIDKFINEIYKYIEMYNIKKIYVMNSGDMIEHISMRKNQSQFCEFYQAEQINKAIELIYRFLVALCKYCDVEYDSIYGNHDRMNGEKDANLDGDNADVIIREQIKTYKELSNNNRLYVVSRRHTDKEIVKNIKNIKTKFIHGEYKSTDGKQLMKNEMSVDNEFYDIIFKGHLHNFKLESENNGRYVVSTGCLSGYNDYSLRFYCSSYASQTICIVGDNGIELIKDVQLQIN